MRLSKPNRARTRRVDRSSRPDASARQHRSGVRRDLGCCAALGRSGAFRRPVARRSLQLSGNFPSSFPRKRGFQQRSWSSILPFYLQHKIKMDSRFRGNDDRLLTCYACCQARNFTVERRGTKTQPEYAPRRPCLSETVRPPKRKIQLRKASTPTRQLNKEIIMKRTLFAIAISLATMGYACAEVVYEDQVLAPVVVEHVDVNRLVQNCTPPQSAPECASFHELIRQSFTEREIGMLFGAATSYPEYRSSYNSVRERYDSLLRYVEDQ